MEVGRWRRKGGEVEEGGGAKRWKKGKGEEVEEKERWRGAGRSGEVEEIDGWGKKEERKIVGRRKRAVLAKERRRGG